jgi:glucose/mannose transport system permease protein
MRNRHAFRNVSSMLAMSPTIFFVLVVYCFGIGWTVWTSFTSSKLLPENTFVGFAQYERLFKADIWSVSVIHVAIFGVLFIGGCLLLGYLLAILIDQNIRFEDGWRTVFLVPSALSFVVVGLAWRWLLDPTLGIQSTVRSLGWADFTLDWLTRQETAIFALVGAGLWASVGVSMIIMLAGLRGVDENIWKATRVDGVAKWRVYVFLVPGLIRPMILTSTVLLTISAIRVYELVVVMTGGGPGMATEMPAKYVMDMLFLKSNLGQATAAATIMLLAVLALVVLPTWAGLAYAKRREMSSGV